jgi:hypothetical protein
MESYSASNKSFKPAGPAPAGALASTELDSSFTPLTIPQTTNVLHENRIFMPPARDGDSVEAGQPASVGWAPIAANSLSEGVLPLVM